MGLKITDEIAEGSSWKKIKVGGAEIQWIRVYMYWEQNGTKRSVQLSYNGKLGGAEIMGVDCICSSLSCSGLNMKLTIKWDKFNNSFERLGSFQENGFWKILQLIRSTRYLTFLEELFWSIPVNNWYLHVSTDLERGSTFPKSYQLSDFHLAQKYQSLSIYVNWF